MKKMTTIIEHFRIVFFKNILKLREHYTSLRKQQLEVKHKQDTGRKNKERTDAVFDQSCI